MNKTLTKLELLSQKGNTHKVDTNISVNFMDAFGVADVFGTRYTLKTPEDFLHRISVLGVNTKGAVYQNKSWVLSNDKQEVVEVVISEIVPEIIPTEEAVVHVETPITEEPVIVEEIAVATLPTLNTAWISTLKNNKQDKEALDKYASETFSIALNQSNTLKNMIKDLETQLSKLAFSN